MKTTGLTFTVTNDLTYDQRMQRICRSLAGAGYTVTLVGRRLPSSIPLQNEPFRQKRLKTVFTTGKGMYLEYNVRLLLYLMFHSTSLVCAIDLDTIMPCLIASTLKRWKRVYDAHELFTEQKEIVTRKHIHSLWLMVERFAVPKFPLGYTVNDFISGELARRYGVRYKVIRNLPAMTTIKRTDTKERIILYQGAVNEGRSFETLIPAMLNVPAKLLICGNGNYFETVKKLVETHQLQSRVELKGYVTPKVLKELTPLAYAGVTLFEKTGLNQYHSLANRYFDYIMAGLPQVCVAYPEYKALNDRYETALLVENTDVPTLSNALNRLLNDKELYAKLVTNCSIARQVLNWDVEEKQLLSFYENIP